MNQLVTMEIEVNLVVVSFKTGLIRYANGPERVWCHEKGESGF